MTKTVATLGPVGTYSAQAAKQYDPNAKALLYNSVSEVVAAVQNSQATSGIIPLENSIEGIVAESLDVLATSELLINSEIVLDVHHALCGNDSFNVQKICSHPQALAQCRQFIAKNYPKAELIPAASTAAAVKEIANKPGWLAIGPTFAASEYKVRIIAENIEDEPGNQTRFVAFSNGAVKNELPFIIASVIPKKDRPGLLHDILSIIKEQGVNMLQIDSRPDRKKLGSYIFYVRLALNSNDDRFSSIVSKASEIGVDVKRMSR